MSLPHACGSQSHSHASFASTTESISSPNFETDNQLYYDKPGRAHAHSTSASSIWQAQRIQETVTDLIELDPDTTTILDFACGRSVILALLSLLVLCLLNLTGSGLVSQALIGDVKRIVGVDISQSMVDQFNLAVRVLIILALL